MFYKKGVLENFTKLTEKHRRCSIKKGVLENFTTDRKTPVPESFLMKLQGSAYNFIKKRDSGTGVSL